MQNFEVFLHSFGFIIWNRELVRERKTLDSFSFSKFEVVLHLRIYDRIFFFKILYICVCICISYIKKVSNQKLSCGIPRGRTEESNVNGRISITVKFTCLKKMHAVFLIEIFLKMISRTFVYELFSEQQSSSLVKLKTIANCLITFNRHYMEIIQEN